MRVARGLVDQGTIVGNTYDKYSSRNPLVRLLMRGFHAALDELVERAGARTIHEVGCGEGYWVLTWNQRGIDARGTDFSSRIIETARHNALEKNLSTNLFAVRSIYDVEKTRDSADLVVCCEVLEHLERPEDALRALQSIANPHVVLSVPREPLWRTLNVVRGRYLARLGNTPGHLQHWSSEQFLRLVEDYFELLEVCTPIPWTMVLGRVRA